MSHNLLKSSLKKVLKMSDLDSISLLTPTKPSLPAHGGPLQKGQRAD